MKLVISKSLEMEVEVKPKNGSAMQMDNKQNIGVERQVRRLRCLWGIQVQMNSHSI